MKVLIVNCGSSSVKYTLFEMEGEKRLAKGIVECIGLPEAYFKQKAVGMDDIKESCKVQNHVEAIDLIINKLLATLIKDINEISAIGHRVVHGGDKFYKSVPVNKEVMQSIRECFEIAPLHTPHHYAGIEATQKLLNGIPEVVVFDTAFYQSMPDYAFMYGLPYELYEEHHIRRYGFHGTSHNYVVQRAASLIGTPLEKLKIISCHIGNGCSITATKYGKAIDTSMGFTPLEGLMMGTRCGDIDPAIILHLMKKNEISIDDFNVLLNKKSGLFGISGLTGDMRTILKAASSGSEKATLALNMFCYRIKKYIGSYYGIMNGADVIVFTAGIGENSPTVRENACKDLENLGIVIDKEANVGVASEEKVISSSKSKVKVMVIPTNEELMIARETVKVLTNS